MSIISFFKVSKKRPPFVEFETNRTGVFLRVFDPKYDNTYYQWHKDDEDRDIEVLASGDDWYFQFDDKLPQKLQRGQNFRIH